MIDYKGTGVSVMELSHREKEFIAISEKMKDDLREFLQIPPNFKILYFQGGASMQYASIIKNLLKFNPDGSHRNACYVNSGMWSNNCINQAKVMFGN